MTAAYAYSLFKSVRRTYADEGLPKYKASGKHNQHDFYNYCNGNIEVHLSLEKIGSQELNSFCGEGSTFIQGTESIKGSSTISTQVQCSERSLNSDNSSSSSYRKRKDASSNAILQSGRQICSALKSIEAESAPDEISKKQKNYSWIRQEMDLLMNSIIEEQ